MAACLVILAASGLLSCADTPVQAPDSVSLATVPGTDSVNLTYICGNMFRVRNSSFEPRNVRWDIYNVAPADTGSLRARGRDVGSGYVDYFVTSRTKGTMRLFVGATLVDTKANGNKVACAAPVDTNAFPSSEMVGTFDFRGQPGFLRSDSTVDARTLLLVEFAPSATAAEKRALQQSLGAQIVRVWTSSFVRLRVPDPGNSAASMDELLSRARSRPGVSQVQFTQLRGKIVTHGGVRYPTDGLGQSRADHLSMTQRTWAARSTRMPQAWWCETGRYGLSQTVVAVVEANIGAIPSDLGSGPGTVLYAPQLPNLPPENTIDAVRDFNREHAASVVGVLGSRGDNSQGIAGAIWYADYRLLSLQSTNTSGASLEDFADYYVPEIVTARARFLSLSTDYATNSSSLLGNVAMRAMRGLLDSLPQLLILKSAGNDSTLGVPSNVPVAKRTALQDALTAMKSQGYDNRIMLVGATNRAGNRAAFSNELSGALDIYAPGDSIISANRAGFPVYVSGTSLATPIVAGFGAQLLTMDPSLTAAEIKQLLLAGARDNEENANGDNVPPPPVGNTSDVVYEADAFGSLRVLSGQKQGIPICDPSFAYWKASAAQPSGPKGWRAIRYGGTFDDRFDQPGMPGRESGYSLAPGGRLLATGAGLQASRTGGVRLRKLVGGAWTDSTIVGTWDLMQFGERDVLYARGVGGVADTVPDVEYLISGVGRSGTLRRAFNNSAQRVVRIVMRPDGEGVAIVAERNQELFLTLVDAGGVSSAAVSLASPSATPQIVHADIFWRPDSRALVVTQSARDTPVSTSQAWGTNVKFFEVSGSGALTFRSNLPTSSAVGQVVTARWGSGGVRFDLIGFRELVSSECNTFASRATQSGSAISTATVNHNDFCGENQSVDPNPGGGSCSDLCEDACCFGIFKINKRNFPIARIRADSQARRVNY